MKSIPGKLPPHPFRQRPFAIVRDVLRDRYYIGSASSSCGTTRWDQWGDDEFLIAADALSLLRDNASLHFQNYTEADPSLLPCTPADTMMGAGWEVVAAFVHKDEPFLVAAGDETRADLPRGWVSPFVSPDEPRIVENPRHLVYVVHLDGETGAMRVTHRYPNRDGDDGVGGTWAPTSLPDRIPPSLGELRRAVAKSPWVAVAWQAVAAAQVDVRRHVDPPVQAWVHVQDIGTATMLDDTIGEGTTTADMVMHRLIAVENKIGKIESYDQVHAAALSLADSAKDWQERARRQKQRADAQEEIASKVGVLETRLEELAGESGALAEELASAVQRAAMALQETHEITTKLNAAGITMAERLDKLERTVDRHLVHTVAAHKESIGELQRVWVEEEGQRAADFLRRVEAIASRVDELSAAVRLLANTPRAERSDTVESVVFQMLHTIDRAIVALTEVRVGGSREFPGNPPRREPGAWRGRVHGDVEGPSLVESDQATRAQDETFEQIRRLAARCELAESELARVRSVEQQLVNVGPVGPVYTRPDTSNVSIADLRGEPWCAAVALVWGSIEDGGHKVPGLQERHDGPNGSGPRVVAWDVVSGQIRSEIDFVAPIVRAVVGGDAETAKRLAAHFVLARHNLDPTKDETWGPLQGLSHGDFDERRAQQLWFDHLVGKGALVLTAQDGWQLDLGDEINARAKAMVRPTAVPAEPRS